MVRGGRLFNGVSQCEGARAVMQAEAKIPFVNPIPSVWLKLVCIRDKLKELLIAERSDELSTCTGAQWVVWADFDLIYTNGCVFVVACVSNALVNDNVSAVTLATRTSFSRNVSQTRMCNSLG